MPSEPQPPEIAAAEERLRARTLLRLLPAQVHRLRNALAVVQGVCELSVQGQPRASAQAKLALLNEALERLALLAREPSVRVQSLEVEHLFRSLELFLRPLERSGVVLELRCDGPAATQADGRLELLLLDACSALLAGSAARPGRLRLSARATPAGLRLALAVEGRACEPGVLAPLAAYAAELGWPCATRRSARAAALRLVLPAHPGTALPTPRVLASGQRLLLVHRVQDERELLAAVLGEHGHVVEAHASVPESGSFDLALLERRLVEQDPDLPRRVREGLGLERIELLAERLGPDALLELVRNRS